MEEIKKLIKSLTSLIEQRFEELKILLQSQPVKKEKRKRKLSAYNLFMKECLKKETGTYPERFAKCAAKYKKLKKNGRVV